MNTPFLLQPAAKDYLWGGTRLNDDFGKSIHLNPLAETWECSTHPNGNSVVAETGETLSSVLSDHPEYLGTHALHLVCGQPKLPVMIKLIDAKLDLSVQVHPSDEYALSHEGEWGKTEMWYVLAAKSDAKLVYGFNQDVSKARVQRALAEGSLEQLLNRVPAAKNDVFFIDAGVVHAIGSGMLVVEIQESSDVTYRLYDYGRVDKNGVPRELHIEKALEVSQYTSSSSPRKAMRVLRYSRGYAKEMLARCRYFQVERFLLNTEINRILPTYRTDGESFHALMCTDGCGSLFGENLLLNFFKGDCIFIPANSMDMQLHGKAELLDVRC